MKLHGPTLEWVQSVFDNLDERGQRMGYGPARTDSGMVMRNFVTPLAHDVGIETGPIGKPDKCTCRVHNRPSAYALTRKRLGIETRT